jgi:hypothetical protein
MHLPLKIQDLSFQKRIFSVELAKLSGEFAHLIGMMNFNAFDFESMLLSHLYFHILYLILNILLKVLVILADLVLQSNDNFIFQ